MNLLSLANLDLFTVAIAIASIGILGFIVFFENKSSITHRTFLTFALAAIVWSIFNYAYNKSSSFITALWLLRIHAFFAVWYMFYLYKLFRVFPQTEAHLSPFYYFIIRPLAVITSLLTLTPLVFTEITKFSKDGSIESVTNGPAIILFGFVVSFLAISGIIIFILRTRRAQVGADRHQFYLVLWGAVITFILHIIFNLLLPAFFGIPRFVPFGAVFIFPFVAFSYYAIIRHHLLNVKVLSTEILTFALTIVSFIDIFFSKGYIQILFRAGIFALILAFGILLIKSVVREVKQREKLEILSKELQSANVKLQEADRMKSQFLSFASHQVKSPMTVVKDYADLIRDGSYGAVPDKVKETATKIKDSADRLIGLVNNLLDLRKLEEGKVEYNFVDMDFAVLTKSVYEELKTLSDAKGLQMTLEIPEGPIPMKGDTEKLRQVLQNLLDNSIKYTEKGFIKLVVKLEGNTIHASVSDSGLGIPKDLIPTLFEQFNRGSKEAKQIQGTGLGLYIAKQFMEAHKGKIWAESEGPGKGSTFRFDLPLGM